MVNAEYWTTIGSVNLADLVFIDEAGVNIAMTRHFARSPKGSRAYGNRPDGRGKNVTMIRAMSLEGIIAAMTFQGSTDTNAFYTEELKFWFLNFGLVHMFSSVCFIHSK
jgi:predicted mannosyl-3-phosphoglycerate phosphatase (HAD superfamily)